MAPIIETGHGKNVANFQRLKTFCVGYGTKYNPSNALISITNLDLLYSKAVEALSNVTAGKITSNNAINARAQAFHDLKPFTTQVVNGLKSSAVPAAAIQDAKGFLRKIFGVRATKAVPVTSVPGTISAEVAEDKKISVSQASYDSLLGHFSGLVSTVIAQENYQPNETDFTSTALQAKLVLLTSLNTAVMDTYTDWYNLRIERDKVLYDTEEGLKKAALTVKDYIKFVFGASSPQYKQVSGLRFTVIKLGK